MSLPGLHNISSSMCRRITENCLDCSKLYSAFRPFTLCLAKKCGNSDGALLPKMAATHASCG